MREEKIAFQWTAIAAVLVLSCASSSSSPVRERVSDAAPRIPASAESSDGEVQTYLVPNYGSGSYAHVAEADMPFRVAIDYPPNSARDGSRKESRAAAIEGMQLWQQALKEQVPWFELEFVVEDREAPVQIEWKRRTTGSAQGRAGLTCRPFEGEHRVGGRMELAIRQSPISTPLTLAEIRLLTAHEFGHVLGLLHCLECDSAMNYAWHTQERILVTESDVQTFRELLAKPNSCGEAL